MGNEDYGKREENHNENRIEGRHGVLEAFRAEQLIERLFVQRGCKDGPVMSILREAKKAGTMVDFVPKERLDQMSETGHHQGVIATISAFRYSEIEDMFAFGGKKRGRSFYFPSGWNRGPAQPGCHHPNGQSGRSPWCDHP